MADYRLYFSSVDGKTFAVDDIWAENGTPEIEIAHVEARVQAKVFEPWQGSHLIRREPHVPALAR